MTNQALTDLQAAVTALTTLVGQAVTTLNTLAADLAAGNPINPADVEAAATSINAQIASLQAAVTADAPPPPAPAPAPAAAPSGTTPPSATPG